MDNNIFVMNARPAHYCQPPRIERVPPKRKFVIDVGINLYMGTQYILGRWSYIILNSRYVYMY